MTVERTHRSLLKAAQTALQDIIKTTTHRGALDCATKALAEVRFTYTCLNGEWLAGTVVPVAKRELNYKQSEEVDDV